MYLLWACILGVAVMLVDDYGVADVVESKSFKFDMLNISTSLL